MSETDEALLNRTCENWEKHRVLVSTEHVEWLLDLSREALASRGELRDRDARIAELERDLKHWYVEAETLRPINVALHDEAEMLRDALIEIRRLGTASRGNMTLEARLANKALQSARDAYASTEPGR